MTTAHARISSIEVAPRPSPAPAGPSAPVHRSEAWLYGGLAGLILLAWGLSRSGLFRPGDDFGYWLGVVGGSMMALLFLYPLRKRSVLMSRWGKLKWWFAAHMLMGVFGPWLILLHSTFHVGSLNAAVALYSMGVVVASGIIGRFIYVRIHRGLAGERISLQALQSAAGSLENEARAWLAFAPEVRRLLLEFEQRELQAADTVVTIARRVLLLPWAQKRMLNRCTRELRAPLAALGHEQHWDVETLARRKRRSRKLVQRYLDSVVRVAQYSAYVRLFALWHVAHIPVLALLLVSAIVHVIAVHAY